MNSIYKTNQNILVKNKACVSNIYALKGILTTAIIVLVAFAQLSAQNSYLGDEQIGSAGAGASGVENVYIGSETGLTTVGSNNTFLGAYTAANSFNGNGNLILGSYNDFGTGNSGIVIGNNFGLGDISNQLFIGNGTPLIWGDFASGDLTLGYNFNILGNGNVGIGTAAPSQKLSVMGNIDLNDGELYLRDATGNTYGIGYGCYGASQMSIFSDALIDFRESDGSVLRAQYDLNNGIFYFNGKMGIGTTSPSQKLHVVGNSYLQGYVYIGSTDTYLFRDAANRIATDDQFYVRSSSPNTYLYSANTYLGYTSGDNIHLRGNKFTWTSGAGGIINTNGRIGIGTTSPSAAMHINVSGVPQLLLDGGGNTTGDIVIPDGEILQVGHYKTSTATYTDRFRIDAAGNIGIGTITVPTGYKLAVAGKILAEEIVVDATGTGDWPDYVFAKNYELKTLSEVEEFIEENSHLPEVPSAAEVTENGIGIGEMNAVLLKKIEELTLYMIELEKTVKQQQLEINQLKK